jgi:protein phosphatase
VFVGDFVDRGPGSPDVMRLLMAMVSSGAALAVIGNHDDKFRRWLGGRSVRLTHGLEQTVAQFGSEPAEFHAEVGQFIAALPYCLWLDGGRLAVAHAGIAQHMIGTDTPKARAFCLYGDTDGETDAHGLALRYDWAQRHRGPSKIIYGHTPVPNAEWRLDTLCIDTACCFGGSLTALRWPENELVSVPAARAYAELRRPLGHPPPRPEAKSLP